MSWILYFYPGITIFRVDNTHGTTQDIVFAYSLTMVMNQEINLEFLDYFLIILKEDSHLLHKKLFVIISLVEMVGQCRLL